MSIHLIFVGLQCKKDRTVPGASTQMELLRFSRGLQTGLDRG